MNNDKTYIAEQYNIIDAIDCIKEKAVAAIGENYKIKHSLRMIKSEVGKMLCMAQNNHIDDKTYNEGFISGYEAALMYIDGIVNTMIDQYTSVIDNNDDDSDSNKDMCEVKTSIGFKEDVDIPSHLCHAVAPISEYRDIEHIVDKAFTPNDVRLNDFYNKKSCYPRLSRRGYSNQLMETIAVFTLTHPYMSINQVSRRFHVSFSTVNRAINLLNPANSVVVNEKTHELIKEIGLACSVG